MLDIAERFAKLESHIEEEKGPFTFFAIFRREDAPHVWDVLVAAPWISEDARPSVVDYFIRKIESLFGKQELVNISRFILVDPEAPTFQEFSRRVQVEHGRVEMRDRILFGQDVREAYIITSRSHPAPANV